MKKFLKGLIILLLACATVYCVACYVMWNRISELPETKPVTLLSDHSLKYDETFELEMDNISIAIPTYYACMDMKEFSSYYCDAHTKNKSLLVMYRPFNEVADKVMPGFSKEYEAALAEFESGSYPFPISLTHETPNSLFGVLKEVYLIDKNDYSMWNLLDSFYLYYCLEARTEAEAEEGLTISYMYERDNVRAFVVEDPNSPGTYVIMILPGAPIGNIYAMIVETGDPDDITKLLNAYEFK